MNFALKEPRSGGGFFIISIVKSDDKFLIQSKRIDQNGKILVWNNMSSDGSFEAVHYATLQEAKNKAEKMMRIKRKQRGMIDMLEANLPDSVKKRLAAPLEAQTNSVELLKLMEQARKERYVTFKNADGLEEFFDLGVEYVGYITDDDNLIEVFDKFGRSRGVLVDRLASIMKTEQCIEVGG
jgi:Fe-S cluster assembly scaffold protein SufB